MIVSGHILPRWSRTSGIQNVQCQNIQPCNFSRHYISRIIVSFYKVKPVLDRLYQCASLSIHFQAILE